VRLAAQGGKAAADLARVGLGILDELLVGTENTKSSVPKLTPFDLTPIERGNDHFQNFSFSVFP
jgi:hypothetical protein